MIEQKQMTVAGGALRRIGLVLLVAALMVAMMAVSAGSALARASDNEKANTVGRNASFFNEFGHKNGDNGLGGKLVAREAPVGDAASTDK
jgi:hypothetical protein